MILRQGSSSVQKRRDVSIRVTLGEEVDRLVYSHRFDHEPSLYMLGEAVCLTFRSL